MEHTIILGVKNEEKLLPQVLPSIRALDPHELIVCLHQCTDQSERIIQRFCKKTKLPHTLLYSGDIPGWSLPKNAVYNACLEFVETPITMRTTADVLLDPAIKNYLPLVSENLRQKTSFRTLIYPMTWRFALKKLRTQLGPKQTLHDAVYAIGTEYFKQIRFKPTDISDSFELYQRIMKTGGTTQYIPVNNYYLRPNSWEDSNKRLAQLGKARAECGFPLWKSVLNAVLYRKPSVLREHLREKLRR